MKYKFLIISSSIALVWLFILNSNQLLAQKYDAEVIKLETTYKLAGQSLISTVYLTIQINKRVGDKFAEFKIPYSKNIKFDDLNAWIEASDGTVIRKIKKSDITDRSAFTGYLYTDMLIKEFTLKHNVYPYRVVCTYTTVSKNYMEIADWTPVYDDQIPTLDATLQVILPVGFNYKKYSMCISDPQISYSDKQEILKYTTAYPEPVKAEIFSNASRKFPRVIIVPTIYNNEISGSWESWQTYGDWISALNKGLDILTLSEKEKVSSIIAGVTNKREIVKVLYHYMQDNTRYVNVSIGIGALKPYPAEYVCKNKYGDCKALTNYMKSLLEYAGIESFYTLIHASDPPEDFIAGFPFHQFNHAVLAVPIENDTIWLENTSNINPFGYMGTSTQNRYALLIKEGNSKLVKVPPLKNEDVLVMHNMNFKILNDGDAEVDVKNVYKGDDFEILNQLLLLYNNDDKDRIIRQSMMFDNYEVLVWNMYKKQRDTAAIELDVKLKLSRFVNQLGKDHYFSLSPLYIPPFTNPANRKLPVFIPYPIVTIDTHNYILPEGYVLKNVYTPVYITSPYGTYSIEIKETPGGITAIKSFQLYSGDYLSEQYSDFYKFIDQVKSHDKLKIVIKQL